MTISALTKSGNKGTLTVNEAVVGVKMNKQLLSQAVRVYLSNKRQGTSKVKSRGEVTLTKKKWYKQKGTGNARHGAKSAPIFVGGGVAHGPTGLENWSRSLSGTMKRKALAIALSAQAENMVAVDHLLSEQSGKTKAVATILAPVLADAKKVLVLLPARDELLERALRNMSQVTVGFVRNINALDIVRAQKIIVSTATMQALEERVLPRVKAEKAKAEAPVVAKKKVATEKTDVVATKKKIVTQKEKTVAKKTTTKAKTTKKPAKKATSTSKTAKKTTKTTKKAIK